MKATEAKLLEFLKKLPQFFVPICQRTYSTLTAGARRSAANRRGLHPRGKTSYAPAFVGSIVYVEKGLSWVSSSSPAEQSTQS